jgi:hypothetical protein
MSSEVTHDTGYHAGRDAMVSMLTVQARQT